MEFWDVGLLLKELVIRLMIHLSILFFELLLTFQKDPLFVLLKDHEMKNNMQVSFSWTHDLSHDLHIYCILPTIPPILERPIHTSSIIKIIYQNGTYFQILVS